MTEPVLVSIAAAVAGKSMSSLYELVKRKVADRRDAEEMLEVTSGTTSASSEMRALAANLADAASSGPASGLEARQQAGTDNGGVVNQIMGSVTGKVVQARHIEGGVKF